jgi:ATP-dependent DNA ligase
VIGFVWEGSARLLKLHLAKREQRGVYVGRVGTGWDRQSARALRQALDPLARGTPPLAKSLEKSPSSRSRSRVPRSPKTVCCGTRYSKDYCYSRCNDKLVRASLFSQ